MLVEHGVYNLGHTESAARNRQDSRSLSQIVIRKVMQEPPSKRPPNLTVHSLSTSAHEDSLFSPGVNTPGHRVPLSKQDLFEVVLSMHKLSASPFLWTTAATLMQCLQSKTGKRQEQTHSTSYVPQKGAKRNSKASWLCCCSQRTADDTAGVR